ncbi:MAG: signal transduction histidine kinase [Oleispira sp.]|jgi:signal transduction histidine kinase
MGLNVKSRVTRFSGAIFVYILGVFLIASISYIEERDRFLNDIDQRLLAAASNISAILPADFHDLAHSANAISDEQDQHNLELMSLHAGSGDLTYLYSYVMVEGKIYFTSCNYTQDDIKNNKVVTYWTDYPEGAPEYFEAMTAKEPIYVTAGDSWGLFRTILIPMLSPEGFPYVAAADMDITVIENSLQHAVLYVIGMSIVLLAIAIPLILAYRSMYGEMNEALVKLNTQLQSDVDQALILEAELKQVTHNANVANEIKGQFLSNMSHELRTPISGILGMNKLLMDTCITEKQEKYVGLCNMSAQVLLDTVNQILDVAAIEAGGLKVQREAVETEGFFQGIVALFTTDIAEKRLDLVLTFSHSVPAEIDVDPVNFRKVLINLIGNAIKFTHAGGIRVVIGWRNGCLQGEVSDTGIGIPDIASKRIFETFQQVDNSYAREHGGTGLGLPISRQICNMLQGELSLLHSDEKGSTFDFFVKTRALSHSFIQPMPIPLGGRFCVYTDSVLFKQWFINELGAENVDIIASIDQTLSSVEGYSFILVDGALNRDARNYIFMLTNPDNARFILVNWVGQQIEPDMCASVRILDKPLTRTSLVSACLFNEK